MAKFNITCMLRVKWWVKPALLICTAWVAISRKQIDADRLAHFICEKGIRKQFITREI